MKLEIILNLFRQFFIYIAIAGVSIKVYKHLKTENITLKDYLIKRKSRVVLALIFIAFNIGYMMYRF